MEGEKGQKGTANIDGGLGRKVYSPFGQHHIASFLLLPCS